MKTKKLLPQAKTENIVEQVLKTEVLLYDLKINRAYCLNETAAVVYKHCDGKTDFADLRRLSGKNISDEVIYLAIEELDRLDLLKEKTESGISRRALLQKAALSAVALPLITSLIAPRAIQAQSGEVCSPDGTLTGGQTSPFADYFCFQDADPTCCAGVANADFDTCVRDPNLIYRCQCVCGPQRGRFPG